MAYYRYEHIPGHKRAGTYDSCIPQSDDIAQSDDSCTHVEFEYNFSFIGHHLSHRQNPGSEDLAPPAKSCNDEIIDTAYEPADQQQCSLVTSFFARYQHLSGCSSF